MQQIATKSFSILLLCTAVALIGATVHCAPGGNNASVKYDITVANDGTGTFKTVQEAFNAIPEHSQKAIVVFIRNGVYKEKLVLSASRTNVHLIGENADSVVLTYDDHSGRKVGEDTLNTYNCYSTSIESDDFTAENITFENNAGFTAGQSVALQILGDRIKLVHCRLVGFQDVFFTKGTGRCYVSDSYIEGTTDFIFGASILVLNKCTIVSKKKSHVTAASTPQGNKFGYVLMGCTLKATDGIQDVSLGRPWRPYAQVVYIGCEIGGHIGATGWNNFHDPEKEKTAYFAEYQCTGPGADRSGRLAWTHVLTPEEATRYTLKNIFSAGSAVKPFAADWDPLTTP